MSENIWRDSLVVQERSKRDALLAESDWTQLKDVPVEVSEQWQEYRQALRDVPQQEGFPFQVNWPSKP